MVCDKYRIRFEKSGDLRFISHHDLMRCFERILRRANLPFHSTSGFNPKPRLIFAMPLPLGIAGNEEIAELELDQPLSADEVRERLANQSPTGLRILSVHRIDGRTTAHVHQVCYRVSLGQFDRAEIERRSAALLAASECWIERTRPETRRVDLRPYLVEIRLQDGFLEMDLRVTPRGTARPEEILGLLGLESTPGMCATIERTRVELLDEAPAAPAS
jgi:radical SAM-linked protein